jgi:hypothetical protein
MRPRIRQPVPGDVLSSMADGMKTGKNSVQVTRSSTTAPIRTASAAVRPSAGMSGQYAPEVIPAVRPVLIEGSIVDW